VVPRPFSCPLFTLVRGIGILRTSPLGGSRKFASARLARKQYLKGMYHLSQGWYAAPVAYWERMGQLSEHEGRYGQELQPRPDASDASSFDDLAKGLASGTLSRRKALRMLGAAVVGGALASFPGMAWAAPCPKTRVRCAGECCAEGVTACQGTGKNKTCGPVPVTCPTGQTLCDGQCVNTLTDEAYCGSCYNNCNAGQTCVDGGCQYPCVNNCCCACYYTDNATGAQIVTCDPATTLTSEQCRTFCANTAPANSTDDFAEYGCTASYPGYQITCEGGCVISSTCAPA
jgi:hypothetical protein